jgi:hypothetical protein
VKEYSRLAAAATMSVTGAGWAGGSGTLAGGVGGAETAGGGDTAGAVFPPQPAKASVAVRSKMPIISRACFFLKLSIRFSDIFFPSLTYNGFILSTGYGFFIECFY